MYRIAIPSYKRPDGLKNKTIRTLLREGYTPDNIDIFVSNEEERIEYSKVLPEYNLIVSNTMGIQNKRNFIHSYYPVGQRILSLDDDIIKINYASASKYKKLKDVVPALFNQMDIHNTILGGFFPSSDPRCMRNEWERGLCFILGAMHCYIANKEIKMTLSSSDDNELTILVYEKYKNVVRYGLCGPDTRYWVNKGGISASQEDRQTADYMEKFYLAETYPEYVTFVQKKDRCDLKYNIRLKVRYTD